VAVKSKRAAASSSNSKTPDRQVMLESAEPEVPRAAYTIKEFCAAHRISEAMYFKLRDAGLGPREMRALRKVTISVEAAAEWRRERENATIAGSDAGQD
jgi:hypothetical protein